MDDIEAIVGRLAERLLSRQYACVSAESCTGGWIAKALTALPGSSNWFDCGFVTYSNSAKCKILGIDQNMLDSYGAVSEEVARAMALGAIAQSNASVAVSVTGIAGPDGGTDAKPVGTVAFGWVVPGLVEADSELTWFAGDRSTVRRSSVLFGLEGLIARL